MYLFGNSSLLVNLVLYIFMIALTGFALVAVWVALIEINLLVNRMKSDRAKNKAENEYIRKIEEIHDELY